jgi:hypothetical protein
VAPLVDVLPLPQPVNAIAAATTTPAAMPFALLVPTVNLPACQSGLRSSTSDRSPDIDTMTNASYRRQVHPTDCCRWSARESVVASLGLGAHIRGPPRRPQYVERLTWSRGACLPLTEQLPLLPVQHILRALADQGDGMMLDVLQGCPPVVRNEIQLLVLGLVEGVAPSREPDANHGWRRRQLYDAVRQVLVEVSRRRPLAVVVEDVHWADPSTLNLLEYVLTPGARTTIPLIATWRTGEPATSSAPTSSLTGPSPMGRPRAKTPTWQHLRRSAATCQTCLKPLRRKSSGVRISRLRFRNSAKTDSRSTDTASFVPIC